MHAHADDGAASIAAGGLVVMGRETRVTMAKEVLKISMDKVIVDYDFRNDGDEDVTTQVAFPIPDYEFDMSEMLPSDQGFDHFLLWIDGQPTAFKTETRALVKGKDLTQLLAVMHVDVGSFGHSTSNDHSPDILRLSDAQRKQLERAGLLDSQYDEPNWTVRKKYYWQQTFPAHKVVHIRHEYTPVLGSDNSISYGMGPGADPASVKELQSFCFDNGLRKTFNQLQSQNKDASYFYVDFILTTANTWKTPIEDFTLIVERPHLEGELADYVSFCWDGPVTKIDADHFSAKATNFIPAKELRIGFFGVEHRRF
jgi:hypothetical protein